MATGILLNKGRFQARVARSAADLTAAQMLRTVAFGTERTDQDEFDSVCAHILVEDMRAGGQLVCCFRMLTMQNGGEIGRSYSARYLRPVSA